MNVEETHKNLTKRIKEYIVTIVKEYGSYMPEDVLNRLSNITNFDEILKIEDYGDVSAYATDNNVYMPLCADKILNMASKIPLYGINKNHKSYNSSNIVINNNTFITYLKHVFVSGTNAEGYYEDLLLHEVMHFCGSGGGTVLEEGTNELLTRMLAKKYNLRTNSCGYPKEVKLAYELMQHFGEETTIKLAFISNYNDKLKYLKNTLGDDAANLYSKVSFEAEKEFSSKYYAHMNEFVGVTGIAKKVLFYNKIDYSNIYSMLKEYSNNLNNEQESKTM